MTLSIDREAGARPRPAGRERPVLGQLLRARGWLGEPRLADALAEQARAGAPLGRVLVAGGWLGEEALAGALAAQHGLGHVDLEAHPPDPALADPRDAPLLAREGLGPWRRTGRVTVFAAADPARAGAAIARLAEPPALACVAVAGRPAVERAVARLHGPALAARAAARTPARHSVRAIPGLRLGAVAALALLLALMVLGGPVVVAAGLGLLVAVELAASGLRLAALLASRRRARAPAPPPGDAALASRRALPRVSLLVPLYREAEMIPEIVRALSALDYPRARLEVRLLLEEGDHETRRAVAAAALPGWIRPMVVPDGRPRTKPRALNAALDFCRGDIVGILDAEDRPAPDQLRRVADAFAAAPPDLACVQCELGYYNARENWISRCFQLEYGLWFGVVLKGVEALGLPIPLGGTSCYLRRAALERVGGWDAQNVTEDADLGMRLARFGYRARVIDSTTEEEANCRAAPWVRQRSRWLKGYLLTLLSHMRAPRALWRELGARGTFGLGALFLGAVAAHLAMPLFWIALLGWALTGQSPLAEVMDGALGWAAAAAFGLGWAVLLAASAIAMRRRGMLDLLLWLPTVPLYWTLGSLAAWKAVVEIATAPFYWDKTRHGVSRFLRGAAREPARAAPRAQRSRSERARASQPPAGVCAQ